MQTTVKEVAVASWGRAVKVLHANARFRQPKRNPESIQSIQ